MTDTSQITIPPQVEKKEEYLFFIENVQDGFWQNSTYLAELCGVDRTTIARWKETQPVIAARKRYNATLRKAYQFRADFETKMKEAGMRIDPERLDITSGGLPIFGGKSVQPNNSNT